MVAFGYILPPFGYIVNKSIYESTMNGAKRMEWPRIANLRIDNDLTQQQVADILHCKREVYRRYEKGTRELPLSYAIVLADYYKVSLDYLVGRSNKK